MYNDFNNFNNFNNFNGYDQPFNDFAFQAEKMRYRKASDGIEYIAKGQKLTLVALAIMAGAVFILMLSLFGRALGLMMLCSLAIMGAAVIIIIGSVFGIVGIAKASGTEKGYSNALVLMICSIICNFFKVICTMTSVGSLGSIFGTAGSLLGYISAYFIISATSGMLRNIGRSDLESDGRDAWRLMIVTIIATIIMGALSVLLGSNSIVVSLVMIAALVTSIAATIKYMNFLRKASAAFII